MNKLYKIRIIDNLGHSHHCQCGYCNLQRRNIECFPIVGCKCSACYWALATRVDEMKENFNKCRSKP